MSLLQWFHDSFSPLVNVDGTPMATPHIDVHGQPYGVTSSGWDAPYSSTWDGGIGCDGEGGLGCGHLE